MAHFAELDDSNTVLRVIVVNNLVLLDENGIEQESIGIEFCKSLFGGNWIQTSYNGKFRKTFAGIDYTYDPNRDVFVPPQPYPSWRLDTELNDWLPPVPYPNDGKVYIWNERVGFWETAI